jgi:hypothetical protein
MKKPIYTTSRKIQIPSNSEIELALEIGHRRMYLMRQLDQMHYFEIESRVLEIVKMREHLAELKKLNQ